MRGSGCGRRDATANTHVRYGPGEMAGSGILPTRAVIIKVTLTLVGMELVLAIHKPGRTTS
jgi:hypothetical protein